MALLEQFTSQNVQEPKKRKAQTFVVNGRYRAHKVAGQQRYANELIARMGTHAAVVEPDRPLKGLRGHAWEQFSLPRRAHDHLLWSPCQTGPLTVRNQVVTFHDLFALENPEWFSTGYSAWYGLAIPRLARHSRALITVSEYTKGRLVELLGIAPEKITAIHSGVSQGFRPQAAERIAEMRHLLRLPAGRYVLSVSSLEPRKNLPRILAAWKAALPNLPSDCNLVLAGARGSDGVFASQDLDSSIPRVQYTGYVPEALLPTLYSDATAFVYPSLAEGFGMPVIEAMSCGTPVLTSDTSSLPEIAGDAALFVSPESVDEIARGIATLVNSAACRSRLRALGLARKSLFNWDRAAEQTLSLLLKVADE